MYKALYTCTHLLFDLDPIDHIEPLLVSVIKLTMVLVVLLSRHSEILVEYHKF